MDIKNKFPPSPPKGAGVDAKKNQDVVNTKVYPQKRRKRELTGAGNFSKNEQPRKWNVQKAKDTVKRPRAKGQYHGGTEENTKVVASKWAEPGSVLVHGCKKESYLLNGNHLLNFHYEPRNAQNKNIGKSMRNSHNSNRWLPPIQRHKYNKEQFLQASCQFVVIAGGDYSLYWTDPDVLVDWKLVEQIKVHSSENLSCPICLCPPVAGKMTRCGHVYCWPCILHYIDVSDKKDASCKCPICYATVHKKDLKSMVEITQTTFNLGDTLNLRLMRRERGSVLATPVVKSMTRIPPTTFLSASETSDNQIYSKLLIASVQDIIHIIESERVQLELEYEDYPDCYIEQALNELSQRENELLLKVSEDALSTEDTTEKKIAHQTSRENEVNADACCKNETEFLETAQAEQSSKIVDSASNDSQCASGPSRFIYFYQVDDGQHLYLHAMNVKMLEMQFGNLEHCPPMITGKLLEKEAGSYTEDLKRRLRYLCHLPLTCQFELAEIELKPPLVSEHVLRAFRDQLNLRKERRQRREREEKKRDKKITEEQNKRMGKYPTPNINIESNRHFPQWNPEQLFSEQRALSSPEPTTMSSIVSSPSSSTFDEIATRPENISLEEQQQGGQPSFAEMLRNTRTTPVKSANAWSSVTTSVQSRTRSSRASILSNDDEDVEEAYYASPPSNNQCFGDALARALEKTRLEDSGERVNVAGKKNKKQKKKKTKGTVLFATGMTCAS